ncbi:MAG TPA: hypothetical protein DHU69_04300, partial [Deltaproteobacteria bacterium]|nr:hypothetical protein [Deltaproteobacteria bacterium]
MLRRKIKAEQPRINQYHPTTKYKNRPPTLPTMVDFKAIEEKWKTEWERQEAFEANADPGRKKFFV